MLWSQDSLSGLLICVFAGQLLCIGRWMIHIAMWTEHTGGEEERRYSAIALVGSEMPMQRTCMHVHLPASQTDRKMISADFLYVSILPTLSISGRPLENVRFLDLFQTRLSMWLPQDCKIELNCYLEMSALGEHSTCFDQDYVWCIEP